MGDLTTLEYIHKEIPEAISRKDNFNGDLFLIPSDVLTKRKAWNLLLKRGFTIIHPNKRYLNKGNIYVHNNSLLSYLIIEVQPY